ncbi:MAG: dTMP kinase [Mariprofundaceae bacterium]|nr:dTMP kinase [Mariprofundaceae bacterium]
MSGHFITFEGIDGCGKTTQRKLTALWLREQGLEVVETFEPGDTALGAEIRSLLLSGEHIPQPETELLLFLADRTQHVREVIQPALKRGAVVLCDRFSDSTRAYQLAGRALDADILEQLLKTAELGSSPALTLWFDLPVSDALARMRRRAASGETATRLDEEQQSFHQRVSDAFAAMLTREPARWRRIDAGADAETVQQQVQKTLSGMFL